jgi:undecaprenyl-diphosphatase
VQAIILGIVQGATEFLPVSSSAHLVLVPWLLQWKDPGLAFDTMLHLGTLLAVVAFFWSELLTLAVGLLKSMRDRSLSGNPEGRTAWLLLAATGPAAVLGFLFEDFFEGLFAQPVWVGLLLLCTGALLALGERCSRRVIKMSEMRWLDAVLVGLGQAMAIAPGISRSGATMSVGLWRGLRREAAARFSFLLSVPIILGAGLFQLKELLEMPSESPSAQTLLVGLVAAAISGFLSIRFLLSYLRTRRLYPFAVYCWVAGALSVLLSLTSLR